MIDLEKYRRLSENPLDVVEVRCGRLEARFYANHDERSWSSSVVTVCVEDDVARVASSSCLPTTGWMEYAAAYARALDFVRRAGLVDSAAPTEETK